MRACCFIIVHRVWKRLKTTHQHKNVTWDHKTRGRVPHSVCPEVVRVKSAKRLSRWLWNVRKNSAFSTSLHPEYVNIEKFSSGAFRLLRIHLCARKNSTGKHTNSVQSEKALSRSNGVGMAVHKVKYGFEIVCFRWRVGLDRIWSLVMSPNVLGDFSREKNHQSFFLGLWRQGLAPNNHFWRAEILKSDFTEFHFTRLATIRCITPNLHVCTDLIKIFPVVQCIPKSPRKLQMKSLVFKSTKFIASNVHLPRLQRTHHEGKV